MCASAYEQSVRASVCAERCMRGAPYGVSMAARLCAMARPAAHTDAPKAHRPACDAHGARRTRIRQWPPVCELAHSAQRRPERSLYARASASGSDFLVCAPRLTGATHLVRLCRLCRCCHCGWRFVLAKLLPLAALELAVPAWLRLRLRFELLLLLLLLTLCVRTNMKMSMGTKSMK